MNIRKLAAFMSAVLAMALLAGCGASSASSAASTGDNELGGHLVIYTSEPQDLVTEMIEDFCSKNPGVTYELYRSGTGDVKAKLSTELEAGGTDACILWVADLAYDYDLDDEGLILHYTPAGIENVPEEYKYNNGMGHEVRAIYTVLAYNTLAVSETRAPKDWKDVLDESYKGSLAIANPAYSGGALTALSVHIQNSDVVGWDWYKALLANDVKMEQSNGTLVTKVASGEYKAVVVVDYLPRNSKAEGSPVDYVYPESGSILIPTPICLLNTMPEEDVAAAKAFVDYMYEVDTQKLFVDQGYVPIISEAAEGTGVPTLDDIYVMPMDVEFMRENTSSLLEEFSSLFGTD